MIGIHRLLIVYCDYGRLGNRLHSHANALAWCIENNYNLINLSFSEYADLFENSPKHNSGNFQNTKDFIFNIFSSKLVRNFLRKMLLSDKWLNRLSYLFNQLTPLGSDVIEESIIKNQMHRKKINLIKHWDINCINLIKIHQNKLRTYLKPCGNYIASAENFINDLRSNYDCIVGVHARRGDYATYLDGIHYHSWESYLYWAIQTKKVLENSGNKNAGIVICSDEVPPSSVPSNEDVHFSSSNEVMVDIHLLSLCDYNLGPPSSFGTWISWFGKLPRLAVYNNTEITSLEQFEVSQSC